MVIHHQEVQLLFPIHVVDRAQQHAAGIHAHHLSWRQVGNGHQGLPDQLFRFIEGMDAGENRPVGACPSSRVNCRSFLLFGTAKQSFTFTARKSDLLNVSKSTDSSNNGSISTLEKSMGSVFHLRVFGSLYGLLLGSFSLFRLSGQGIQQLVCKSCECSRGACQGVLRHITGLR